MSEYGKRIAMDRARNRSGRIGHRSGRDYNGYRGNIEYRGDMEYTDGRRGVKGTGRYGIGGSRYYGDRARERDYCGEEWEDDDMYDYDYEDYARGGRRGRRDGHHEEDLHLTKRDIQDWKRKMQNADGSIGEHFDGQRIKEMAERLGIKYKDFDEKELCLTVNMLYSDYCEALKGVIPPEKELMVYVKLAKAFLEDDDFDGDGSEKLALYYYCIADSDEE